MLRERYFWFMVGLLALSSLACNAFAGQVEPVVIPPPTPLTGTPGEGETGGEVVSGAATGTPAAAVTGTTDMTATPSGPVATVLVDLNVRTGPGVQYDRVSFLLEDESVPIIGVDPASGWWRIVCPARTPVAGVQCWISGGDSFSTAVNTSGVPVAEVPPTPTPVPPEPQPGRAIVTFVEDGRLLATTFDPNADNPAAAELVQLLPDETNVQRVFIAPDGRRVAYVRGAAGRNELHVVNLDGRDDRLLVDSEGLPIQTSEVGFSAIIDQVQWLPDGSGLLFNTAQFASGFGGASSQEDLWRVTLGGEPTQLLPFYQGGGLFLVLPTGEVILSKRDAIEKVNADGSNRLRLVTFDFINTASEYIYYPLLQLARDGSTVYTAVPSAEPFGPDAFTRLWRIAGDGAEQIGRLPNTILFHPVQWSANGSRLGYAAYAGNVPAAMVLAEGDGDNAEVYDTADQMSFLGWSGDGQRFLYVTLTAVAVGQVGSDPVTVPIPAGGVVQTADWVGNGRFLIITRFEGGWRMDSGDVNGNMQELLVVSGDDVEYDIWLP
ncbi:MAG: hypothetical protein H6658_01565 [Ardenticatenaceae bacterium]|nr:hypothetical protein [Ardenticatenaceae bacterium]